MSVLSPYRGYQAKVDFSEEDGLFIGEVIGIRDSLNFHAETSQQVIPMFHQSVDNYLELCEKIGKDPDKAYKGSFNVRITPELHRRADLMAAERNISLNQFVSTALEHELDGHATETIYVYMPVPVKGPHFDIKGVVSSPQKSVSEEGEKQWQATM